jgi:hypothetical protein
MMKFFVQAFLLATVVQVKTSAQNEALIMMETCAKATVQSPVMTTKSNAMSQPILSPDVLKHRNVSLK